jgi:hypothetical protein
MGACHAGLRGCCGNELRVGEFEFADDRNDLQHALSLTTKQENNEVLVKHIRSTAAKESIVFTADLKTRLQELEKVVHYAPLLKLKVTYLQGKSK